MTGEQVEFMTSNDELTEKAIEQLHALLPPMVVNSRDRRHDDIELSQFPIVAMGTKTSETSNLSHLWSFQVHQRSS